MLHRQSSHCMAMPCHHATFFEHPPPLVTQVEAQLLAVLGSMGCTAGSPNGLDLATNMQRLQAVRSSAPLWCLPGAASAPLAAHAGL